MRVIPNQKTAMYFTKNGHSLKDIQTINRWTPDVCIVCPFPFFNWMKKKPTGSDFYDLII